MMTKLGGKIFDALLIIGGCSSVIIIIWSCFTQEVFHYEEPKEPETIQITPIFITNYIDTKGEKCE